MHDTCYHIINSFFISHNRTLEENYNYIKYRFDDSIEVGYFKQEISK